MSASETVARAALEAMGESFARARAGATEGGHFTIGGHEVRLRVAGRELAACLGRAISHLELDATERAPAPQLSIDVWSEAETAVPRPTSDLCHVLARTWPFGGGVLGESESDDILGYQTPWALTLLDLASGRAVGWVDSAEKLSLFELGKPLQPLLFAWCARRDTVPIHAGLVVAEEEGVMFGGAGGAGKTTCSLACVKAGLQFLGDDYIGLSLGERDGLRGHSFYGSTWLSADGKARFPFLAPHQVPGTAHPKDKELFLVSSAFPERMARSARPSLLVLPRVVGRGPTSLRSATPGEALLCLAPSSILQLPFVDGAQALERLGALAEAVPAYWLDLGEDISSVPRQVSELAASL